MGNEHIRNGRDCCQILGVLLWFVLVVVFAATFVHLVHWFGDYLDRREERRYRGKIDWDDPEA